MELDGLQAAPSHLAVADEIRRWIALGTVSPGDRLPTEREFAERFGIGRMTARRAVRLLVQEGLVSTQKGRSGGTFVLDDKHGPARGTEMTRQLVRDISDNYDFRLAIEPRAARLAAERAEETERLALRGMVEGESSSVRAFRALDSRFHLAVANASHNRLLIEAVGNSRSELFQRADPVWERLEWSAIPADERDFALGHRPIAEMVLKGDADAAEGRMVAHLLQGRLQFLRLIERFWPDV
jgi:DNA-binding FadR family transcriptional regulator